MYTNNIDNSNSVCSGIGICDISDHYSVFIINPKRKYITKRTDTELIRDMKNFELEKYLEDLKKNFKISMTP